MLDGVLYHESDLDLEEHYTDTHGVHRDQLRRLRDGRHAVLPAHPQPAPPHALARAILYGEIKIDPAKLKMLDKLAARAGWYTFVSAQAHAIATRKAPWVPALGLDAERGQIPDHAPVAQP